MGLAGRTVCAYEEEKPELPGIPSGVYEKRVGGVAGVGH